MLWLELWLSKKNSNCIFKIMGKYSWLWEMYCGCFLLWHITSCNFRSSMRSVYWIYGWDLCFLKIFPIEKEKQKMIQWQAIKIERESDAHSIKESLNLASSIQENFIKSLKNKWHLSNLFAFVIFNYSKHSQFMIFFYSDNCEVRTCHHHCSRGRWGTQ